MFSTTLIRFFAMCLFLTPVFLQSWSAPIPRMGRRQDGSPELPPRSTPRAPMAGSFTGDGTFYAAGLGACGKRNTGADMIAAISHSFFDSFPGATANPNLNPICGKRIRATYKGKNVEVEIVDRCGGCAGGADLDFTPTAFSKLENQAVGRIHGVKWEFI